MRYENKSYITKIVKYIYIYTLYDLNVCLLDFVCPALKFGPTVYFYKKLCMNSMMSFSECAVYLFLLCVCVKFISPIDEDAHRHVTFGIAVFHSKLTILLGKACLGICRTLTS